MPEILILRHAQSVWNAEGRWQGQADPPLSEFGEAQARSAAAALGVPGGFGAPDLTLTSDLERARRTGEILSSGPVQEIADLREYDVGHWSGLTRDEVEAGWRAELTAFDSGRLDRAPGGEGRAAFDLRVRGAASRIADAVIGRTAERVIVVTHGGVIRSLARWQGRPERHVGHLTGFSARLDGGRLELVGPVELAGPEPEAEPDGEADL